MNRLEQQKKRQDKRKAVEMKEIRLLERNAVLEEYVSELEATILYLQRRLKIRLTVDNPVEQELTSGNIKI